MMNDGERLGERQRTTILVHLDPLISVHNDTVLSPTLDAQFVGVFSTISYNLIITNYLGLLFYY